MTRFNSTAIPTALATSALLLASITATPADAEVIVRLSTEPLVEQADPLVVDAPRGPGLTTRPTKAAQPSSQLWFFPFVVDARQAAGPETLFSIRHGIDEDQTIRVDIEVFDNEFQTIAYQEIELGPNQIQTFNMRTIDGVAPDGERVRGFVRVMPTGPVEVDYFEVDSAGSFATGGLGLIEPELCDDWHARFLRFGENDTAGTTLTVLVNGPLGTDTDGRATIRGEVFDESGAFSNSFEIYTDDWLFELQALEQLVIDGGPQFGTVRLQIDSTHDPSAAVFTRHAAFGTYSVGGRAVCRRVNQPF